MAAEAVPEDKRDIVAEWHARGHHVAMAGDGINDAPALAAADTGIAMGTGADVAIKSAGVTLMRGDLNGIVRARLLARATLSNIRQNLFFAFVYNTVGVTIAAGVFYPMFGRAPVAHGRRRRHEPFVAVGGRKRPQAEAHPPRVKTRTACPLAGCVKTLTSGHERPIRHSRTSSVIPAKAGIQGSWRGPYAAFPHSTPPGFPLSRE